MAYVPVQQFRQLYDTSEALQNGTLFKELNLPFLGYLKKGV
ncbi:MAG: spore coat associated protein CotJA [Clostridiales bacterium]|nr:spore coat associated protein CotJA [Clostridiales bacterium]